MDTSVTIEPAYGALDEIRALFAAYTAMLVACDPSFQRYLDISTMTTRSVTPPPSTARRTAGCIWPGCQTAPPPGASPCGGWTERGAR